MQLELTNQSLTTMLLDCIQHYPSYELANESYGLLYGDYSREDKGLAIGEYNFPIGNVDERSQQFIAPNEKIVETLRNARSLIHTAEAIATYHSHPFDAAYVDWARPSNDDCHYFIQQPVKYQLIIAITKCYDTPRPLKMWFEKDATMEFIPVDADADLPKEKTYDRETQFIVGYYMHYRFEIRAYVNTGHSLKDIDLYSSEVLLNELLRQHAIELEAVPREAHYHLKKLEFSHRSRNLKTRDQKTDYHLSKIKYALANHTPLPNVPHKKIINNKSHVQLEQYTLGQLQELKSFYILLEETPPCLCKMTFNAAQQNFIVEDLERHIGHQFIMEKYMIEAGYYEEISVCNITRIPFSVWVEDV